MTADIQAPEVAPPTWPGGVGHSLRYLEVTRPSLLSPASSAPGDSPSKTKPSAPWLCKTAVGTRNIVPSLRGPRGANRCRNSHVGPERAYPHSTGRSFRRNPGRPAPPRAAHRILAFVFIALPVMRVAGVSQHQMRSGDMLALMGPHGLGRMVWTDARNLSNCLYMLVPVKFGSATETDLSSSGIPRVRRGTASNGGEIW